ncbi:MAG: HDIG domain-containing metalloprotein [Candidatus Diapherotrites archaeon]
MIPSRKEALDIMKSYLPQNIIDHSMAVNKVANYLAEKLVAKGEKIDLQLVDTATILHDIDKIIEPSGKNHGKESERILREKGFPEVASVVGKHGLGNILKKGELSRWEDKVVWYADKRVNHDKIVSLDERFAYLRKTYGHISGEIAEIIESSYPKAKELEEEIFNKLDVNKDLGELK